MDLHPPNGGFVFLPSHCYPEKDGRINHQSLVINKLNEILSWLKKPWKPFFDHFHRISAKRMEATNWPPYPKHTSHPVIAENKFVWIYFCLWAQSVISGHSIHATFYVWIQTFWIALLFVWEFCWFWFLSMGKCFCCCWRGEKSLLEHIGAYFWVNTGTDGLSAHRLSITTHQSIPIHMLSTAQGQVSGCPSWFLF